MQSKISVRMEGVLPVLNCVTNCEEFSVACSVSCLRTLNYSAPKGIDCGFSIISLL